MKKEYIKRQSILIFAIFLSAILYNLFILPLNLVVNGTTGIANITHYLYNIDPTLMILILSIIFTIISFLYLGFEKTKVTLIITIIYPIFVKLTAPLSEYISGDVDVIILVLFAGILSGIANGLVYKAGYNTGGTAVINQILYEKYQISISRTSLIINVIVVLLGSYIFGINNALYAVIFLYINSVVTDKVLLGISNNKAFYIITEEEDKVKDYIINVLKHDVTSFNAQGGFFEQKRKVLLTVVPTREYYKMTTGIKKIDNKAFFVVTDSYQVQGGK